MSPEQAFKLVRNGQILDSDSQHVFLNNTGDYFFLISEFHSDNNTYYYEIWPGFNLYLDYNNMEVIIPKDVNNILYGWVRKEQLRPKPVFNIFNQF